MRIVMLTEFYYPIPGGSEQHVRSLSQALVSLGHDVAVITFKQPELSSFEMDGKVRVYRIQGTMQRMSWLFSSDGRRFASPFPDPETTLAIKKVISQEKPEVIHAHNWIMRSFLPLKKWSGAKLVVTLHDYSLACAKKNFIQNKKLCSGPAVLKCLQCASKHYGSAKGVITTLTNWAMLPFDGLGVDKYIAVSKAVADNNGLTTSLRNYQIIPNFVMDDIETLNPKYEYYLEQLPGKDYLLFVGALGRHKGIEILLQTYRTMIDVPPLVLIGMPWPDAPSDYPPNVFVNYNWPREAVMHAWNKSLLGLIPSVWPEPCPTVAMEAMISGRPIIASNIGGLSELVEDQQTGLLVPPGDTSALQKAIQQLLLNPDLRKQLGRAGQHKVDQYKASFVVPQIVQVYQDLVNNSANVTS